MRICYLIFAYLIFSSCKDLNTDMEWQNYCSATFYNDSVFVGKKTDSLIYVKNYFTNTNKTYISQTEYCFIPILKNKYIYFLKNDSIIQEVNTITNETNWTYNAKYRINNFKIFNNFLIINIENKGVKVLSLIDGSVSKEISRSVDLFCNDMLVSDFILDEGQLFITDFNCNSLSCYNFENGELLWHLRRSGMYSTRLLLIDEFVFCGLTGNINKSDGKILLIDKNTGKIIFEKNELFDLMTEPITYNSKIYYVTYDDKIKVFDLINKSVNTIVNLSEINNICDNQIFLLDGKLYFSNCNYDVYEYDINKKSIKMIKKEADNRLKYVFKAKESIKFVF